MHPYPISLKGIQEPRRLDVDPKIGQVLILQHRRLYHSGGDVTQETMYTMRSDVPPRTMDCYEL